MDVMGVMRMMDRKQGMMGRVWCEKSRREPNYFGKEPEGGMGAGGQGDERGDKWRRMLMAARKKSQEPRWSGRCHGMTW